MQRLAPWQSNTADVATTDANPKLLLLVDGETVSHISVQNNSAVDALITVGSGDPMRVYAKSARVLDNVLIPNGTTIYVTRVTTDVTISKGDCVIW